MVLNQASFCRAFLYVLGTVGSGGLEEEGTKEVEQTKAFDLEMPALALVIIE